LLVGLIEPGENRPLRVLVAEDSEDDYLLILAALRRAWDEVAGVRVENRLQLEAQLEAADWDIVLSDYSMPQFTALDALDIVRRSRQREVPFVIVSGSVGEERAIGAIKAGAANFVAKANLGQLHQVIERELADARLRKERSEAIMALRRAIRARDDFLSMASHELKTPLTSLQLQAESLVAAAGAVAHDRVIAKAETIVRSARRLTILIDRILDVTRVNSGAVELAIVEVDLAGLVRQIAAHLEDTFREAHSELRIHAPTSLVGELDRERIEDVITNLLSNAAKYGAGKPVEVELDHADGRARLRVVDHGIGIEPADQQRIFQRFERAVTESQFGGLGIGLWLSRFLIEAHGGTIAVSSMPGLGSTFTVELPLHAEGAS
jgi:signal transduction histidine kinase